MGRTKAPKSHHGCSQCRRRSVKCDEKRPACTNCLSRATNCQYATSGSFTWKDPSYSSSRVVLPISRIQAPHMGLQAKSGQYDDQQWILLSHWRASTYQSASRHHNVEWIWQHLVVEDSLSHPYLLHGLLALSAIHLVTKTNDEPRRTTAIKAAERHQTQAINMLASVSGNLNPSNCNAAFCLCSILAICAWGFPLVAYSLPGPDLLNEFCERSLLVRKMVHMTGVITPWIRNGRLAPLISVPSYIPFLSDSSREVISILSQLNLEIENEEKKHVFRCAINALEILYGSIDAGGEVLVAGSMWIAHTPSRFFELVRGFDPFALEILAYFCISMDCVPGQWWFYPWSRGVLAAVYMQLDERWRGFVRWPLGLDSELDIIST